MIDGWTGLIIFLLAAAPGLLFDLRARRWRVSPHESAFAEVGRIALASIVFSTIGALIAISAWSLHSRLWFDYVRFATDDVYRLEMAPRALVLAGVATSFACFLAFMADQLWKMWRAGDGKTPNLTPDPEWLIAFRKQCPDGHEPFVRVAMDDGTLWLGWVGAYSTEADSETRALVLAGPLARRDPGKKKAVNLDPAYERVVLEGAHISSIAVQYLEP
ncbi:hypothetical protein DBB34_06510 [Sphaerisporangium cinnabarinum]|nr:DUF6338 family protein [Sphaerisporangium cinnabarinum]PTU56959.1 hypothetical protein DBB34_06510 [Sphaerisporangium cinnabarinum]